jgi:tRNA threonylcarbamoyladenosine biosynthesis protein TsaB
MKFYMLVLALDTTTRRGSSALVRDGALLGCEPGDAARTYAERLPGDLMRLLASHDLRVQDVDLFAVAAGPGSFTGLRIGIAVMQGLAVANNRHLAGVSTLDALEKAAVPLLQVKGVRPLFVGAWLDAQRGEVFSALYRGGDLLDGPAVEKPAVALTRWTALAPRFEGGLCLVGDGAQAYAATAAALPANVSILSDVPLLAPAIGQLALAAAARHETAPPDAFRPIYVRRSYVELARDRRAAEANTP